ncbi:MAG: universal stress protein [Crocinitomicaceae bacterium]|nr:universal stress protein [Crocinitomicaceae bacterium]
MNFNLYLVPHDFTAVGDAALKYAMHIGKRVDTEIQVIHIVDDASKVNAAKQKLEVIISGVTPIENVSLKAVVHIGSIFEDIGKIARQEAAQLIIMGTHGATGMQKLFGSHAMKVITSSNVPFLVVQEETTTENVGRIVVPIDLTKESLQIANIAGDIANMFGADIHVVYEQPTDVVLNQKMNNRISIVEKNYDDRKLKTEFVPLNESGTFQKKIIDYSEKVGGNLIALSYHTDRLLPQFDKFAQTLITNELFLPCVIINAQSASSVYF